MSITPSAAGAASLAESQDPTMMPIREHLFFAAEFHPAAEQGKKDRIEVKFKHTFKGVEFNVFGYPYDDNAGQVINSLATALYFVKDPDNAFVQRNAKVSIVDLGLLVSVSMTKDRGVKVVLEPTRDDCSLKNHIKAMTESALLRWSQDQRNVSAQHLANFRIIVDIRSPSQWSEDRATEAAKELIAAEGGKAGLNGGLVSLMVDGRPVA